MWQKVGAKVHVVVGEFILVFAGCLMTVLSRSRTASLLVGAVFVATQEVAEVGNADNRLAASGERGIGVSTEHILLAENVCLPIDSILGNASRIALSRAG